MDAAALLDRMGLSGHPSGIAGCRASGAARPACDLDVVVFDGGDGFEEVPDGPAVIRHASLSEALPARLLGYDGMEVIHDEAWELRMLLSRIRARRPLLLVDHARRCLVEALVCCQQAASPDLGSCWIKAASCLLAGAVCARGSLAPGPSHTLEALRSTGDPLAGLVARTLGAARATPTLLRRMSRSAEELARIAGMPHASICARSDALAAGSMGSDCYVYLCRVSSDALLSISRDPGRLRDSSKLLGTALDAEPGAADAAEVADACNGMLAGSAGPQAI
ncbi:MAG: hypothetical protein MPI95_05230 [Nitrosopumilus sp.]|nr:hypothetical protein [Nitrosopumilus sp.]CAI9832701.1 conserved hypothetical protein [Nitrosopumilaceae archaeon]MDA7940687.1 hypothetical protein [Nitrosopumilus sp.]MDA7942895.1 hypothetical protein [Nitrosopumilus sp.]MDA7944694.1 hypothetical protein [Nitrosopumilus sp.]